MLFNSIEFLIYLPIVFLLYWEVFQPYLKLQNLFIVVVSYIFYGWWNWRLLFLIALTSLLSWGSGMMIHKLRNHHHSNEKRCKLVTIGNIVINLGILATFKYYNFFIDSLMEACSIFGIHLSLHSIQLILPVGISFYTFQALSYTIDVYKRTLKPTQDIVAFFAYVSFFPQLVAGPIERAANLLPQFYHTRSFNYAKAVDGMRQILWGFFKKIVIADNCASLVNTIWDNYEQATSGMLLAGAFLFAFQIYGDFSGYSDIAIGTARLFGIELKRNFHFPYFSRDIAEFWRKWHISLNTWFRDYVYIPLGGSRCGKVKQIRNTFTIFALSGLWHGANWTYVIWGIYHALLFIPLMMLGKNRKHLNNIANNNFLPSFKEMGHIITTFILVMFGWIIFRAKSISEATHYISLLFSQSTLIPNIHEIGLSTILFYSTLLLILLLQITEWIQRNKEHGLQIEQISSTFIRWSIYIFVLMLIAIFPGKQETFIYFQF